MKIWNQALAGVSMVAVLTSCGGGSTEEVQVQEQAPAGITGVYSVSSNESAVKWEGSMLAVGGVSLYGHYGNINISKGEFTFNDGKIESGMVVIDMASISPTDENYSDADGRRASDLVGHLSSNDFFNVAEYPTAEFVVREHTEAGLVGTLTIRGVSNEEIVENVSVQEIDGKITASGTMVFNRQQFDAKFAMPVADKILSDDITLNFSIVAVKG